MKTKEIFTVAANALNQKKAKELNLIEVKNLTSIADYFLLATATSSTHVKALADEVEEKLSEIGIEPSHIEGKATDWILLDYGDVVIHIFGKQSREFYALDRMWNDAQEIDLTEILDSPLED